jgi:hypothetical protein
MYVDIPYNVIFWIEYHAKLLLRPDVLHDLLEFMIAVASNSVASFTQAFSSRSSEEYPPTALAHLQRVADYDRRRRSPDCVTTKVLPKIISSGRTRR